jgi:ABC-type multidrug transport system fused ATPase/permease subunit
MFQMAIPKALAIVTIILCIFGIEYVSAYDTDTCCAMAKADGAFVGPDVPPPQEQICGQRYSLTLTAAKPLHVNYTYCSTKCSGVGISKPNEPRQWAAPIVQFILPSVIFSLSIPRRKKIAYEYLFDWPVELVKKPGWRWINTYLRLARSLLLFVVILLPVIIDTLIWIFVIIVCAAHMLVGALYEAHLDYRIVQYLEDLEFASRNEGMSEETLITLRELLVTVVSGNLVFEKGSPQAAVRDSLTLTHSDDKTIGRKKSRFRLLNLLGAQYSFGSAVGSPVIFYLGAFIYTILDLRNDLSDEDSALSLSFGMEWMIIVHVAIVSGCLLASNNPSTSSGIVGGDHEGLHRPLPRTDSNHATARPVAQASRRDLAWFSHTILGWSDAYETEFQPVSLWSRGTNKMNWIRRSKAWEKNKESFRDVMYISRLGWIFKVCVPTLLLVAIPPAAGAIVAYITPPSGLGCRSLSFIVYAICQFILAIIAVVQNAVDGNKDSWLRWLLNGKRFWAISCLWWFGSLLAVVGGTTMQITGVYRNCVCYAGAENWWGIRGKNPLIQIATDTKDKRYSSSYWVWVGSIAMVFMVFNCYVGWWYQKLIRRRFTNVVMALEPDVYRQVILDDAPVFDNGDSSNDTTRLLSPDSDNLGQGGIWSAHGSSFSGAYLASTDNDIVSPTRYSLGQDTSQIPRTTTLDSYDIGVGRDSVEDIPMRPLLAFKINRRPVPGHSEE